MIVSPRSVAWGSAGAHYRLMQPISVLTDMQQVHVSPDGLPILHGIWESHEKPYAGIVDLDDNHWEIPGFLKTACSWTPEDINRWCDVAHHVTTASAYLADVVRSRGYRATYVQTGIDPREFHVVGEPAEPLVAWRGTIGWARALHAVQPELAKLGSKLFIWGGHFSGLATRPYIPFDQYRAALRNFQRTIEVCPSFDHPFEMSKSPIKMYQAMAAGVPVVVSHLPPYGPEVAGLDVALVYETPGEMLDHIERLLASKKLRRKIGLAGRQWVMSERNIQRTALEFLEVWQCHAPVSS